MARLQILREEIIPLVINKNKFGKNLKLIKVNIDKTYTENDQYASNILFVDVFLEALDEKKFHHSLVVKYEMGDERIRKMMWTELQFHNEAYAYENVLPFIFKTCGRSTDDFFPKFYHGVSNYGYNRPEDDIIILEDLTPKGFRIAEGKLYLDYDHVIVALKKIAEFHSLSYIAKHKRREIFFEKVRKSKDIYVEAMKGNSEPNHIVFAVDRAFKSVLLKNHEQRNEIIQRFKRRVKDTAQLLQDLGTPSEPTAVFCHGDYCRNNILFKYDETTNNPIDIRFIDLAMSRYTSPVIDLSFFLFLNTSMEMRQHYWNDFLNIYCRSLRMFLPPDIIAPTFEQLVEEFQGRAVYGFMHCSFFVPIMINEDATVSLDVISKLTTVDERRSAYDRMGGEKGTQLISEMAQEIIEKGYIK